MLNAPLGEAELIERARAGSSTAFSRLVDMHQHAVRGFLARTVQSRDLADDLAQETFVVAWSRIAHFQARSSFRSWLCAIAYRKALSHTRSALRTRRRETESRQTVPPPHAALQLDAQIDLTAALGRLPPEQRAALALCYGASFSHAEAAAVLGLPLGTVKSHVSRGRARLLELLRIADDDR